MKVVIALLALLSSELPEDTTFTDVHVQGAKVYATGCDQARWEFHLQGTTVCAGVREGELYYTDPHCS